MPLVIVYGSHDCGPRRQQQFLNHFKCLRIVENWDGDAPLRNGDLVFTKNKPARDFAHTRVLSVENAKAEVCNG
ncbi:hypothetical protein [Hydrocarboniphaga sp.]|uniref:hypothetical protein n=1 Tax=Hydrocarboniphaga sp. TaxID=2033016 RepID=UPI003D11F91A